MQKERIVKSRTDWRKHSQVKKLKITMTVIAVALCLSLAAGGVLAWSQVQKMVAGASRPASSIAPVSSASSALPVYDDAFNLILVNPSSPIPPNYKVQAASFDDVTVDSRIVPALKKMMADAEAAGAPLKLTAGYLSPQQQDALYQAEVKRLMTDQKLSQVRAENQAQTTIGKGNYNESQTGLSVVFSAPGQKAGDDFSATKQYRWLADNGVDYGFVLRFPQNKEDVTGMNFSPGRFRYVGSDNAVKMRELSMSLEEYVAYVANRAQG